MQLAAPTSRYRDKSSWPVQQALPANLPAPATAMPARHELWAKFSSGSFASARNGAAVRVSPTWDWETGNPATDALTYLGRDPRRALAAATKLAAQAFTRPPAYAGAPLLQKHTLVGLYRTGAGGSFVAAPLWSTPGTNDWQFFGELGNSFASTPDARFTFRDDRLAAVVGIDGYIPNPAHAAAFLAR